MIKPQKIVNYLGVGLFLAVVVFLMYRFALMSWLFLGEGPQAEPPSLLTRLSYEVQPSSDFSLQSLMDAKIFGDAVQPKNLTPIFKTELNEKYQLLGIFSANGDQARVLIGSGNDKVKSYRLSQSLPDGSKVFEIHAKKVILEKNGAYEYLLLNTQIKMAGDPDLANDLPDIVQRSSSAKAFKPKPFEASNIDATAENMATLDQVTWDQVLQSLDLSLTLQGAVLGENFNDALASVGFEAGDIILSLGGYGFDQLSTQSDTLARLFKMPKVQAKFKRGQAELTLSVSPSSLLEGN